MAFVKINMNPKHDHVGDCVVRAIAMATKKSWTEVYTELALKGLQMYDMPSSNKVWGQYLKDNGFKMHTLPDTCPECYSVEDFSNEYFKGTYVLGTGSHAIAIIDGNYYDTWDSGSEQPIYYWSKGED